MADFHEIIAEAVAALGSNTRDARRRLYDRARAAIDAELRRADPATDPAELLIARMSLEEAIREVENEAQRQEWIAEHAIAAHMHSRRNASANHQTPLRADVPPAMSRSSASEVVPAGSEPDVEPRRPGSWLTDLLDRASRDDDGSIYDQTFAPRYRSR